MMRNIYRVLYLLNYSFSILDVGPTFMNHSQLNAKAIQKVKNVCAYSQCTYFVAADHRFLVFSVMLKSCLVQLYVGPCHVVSAEIAVAIIPYSPDLAPSDFFLFPKMKEHVSGKRFANAEDLKDAVVS